MMVVRFWVGVGISKTRIILCYYEVVGSTLQGAVFFAFFFFLDGI